MIIKNILIWLFIPIGIAFMFFTMMGLGMSAQKHTISDYFYLMPWLYIPAIISSLLIIRFKKIWMINKLILFVFLIVAAIFPVSVLSAFTNSVQAIWGLLPSFFIFFYVLFYDIYNNKKEALFMASFCSLIFYLIFWGSKLLNIW